MLIPWLLMSLLQVSPVHAVQQFFDAYRRLDVDGMTAVMAPGMVFEDPTFRLRANGRDEWRKQADANRLVIASIAADIHSMVPAGDSVAVEYTLSGGIKAKDAVRPFKVRCASFFRVAAGLITRWTDYCDYRTFAEQTISQPTTPFSMARTHTFDVAGRYRISVSLPATYDTGEARFPVVYVLDGDWYFGLAASTARLLEAVQELPPLIVVAIGYGGSITDQRARRIREFTPEPVAALDGSGDGGTFLATLQRELLPAIESRYRTNGDRTLVGHSLGGLFAAYAMTTAPGLFQRVVIGSPALRAAGPALVTALAAQTIHPRRVFLGSAEGDLPFVLEGHELLRRWLGTAPATVQWSAQTFAGMTHQSAVAPLFARALPWVFRDK